MTKRSKLSKYRQRLAEEYIPLVQMLGKFFVQNRPPWQRAALLPDLEGEGFLALCKAARTYDKSRLPYPKAYFARAILNGMLKSVKKLTRQPAEWKVSLQEAADLMPIIEDPDYLALAVDDLGEDRDLAFDRFRRGHTLRSISENHEISLRVASVRARELAKRLAEALEIRLPPPAQERVGPKGSSKSPSTPSASSRHRKSARPR